MSTDCIACDKDVCDCCGFYRYAEGFRCHESCHEEYSGNMECCKCHHAAAEKGCDQCAKCCTCEHVPNT